MSDAIDVSADLTATRAALADAVGKMRRRNHFFVFVSVVGLLFLAVYLGYAYLRFGREVTPELVAGNAEAAFQNALPDTRVKLEQSLKQDAPRQVDLLFTQLKDMPTQYADNWNQQAVATIDQKVPDVEEQMYKDMKEALDKAKDATTAAGGNAKDDEARLKASLAAVAEVYATETLKLVDQLHNTYLGDANSFIEYLNHLATAPNLNHQDQLHRDMFRTFFALVHDRSDNPRPGGESTLNLISPKPAS